MVTPTAPNSIFPQTSTSPSSPLQTRQIDCHGQWEWESKQALGTLTDQAQLLVSTVFGSDLCGLDSGNFDTVSVYAKFMVNNTSRLEWAELSVMDAAGNKFATSNLVGSLSNGTWYVACLTGVALSNFEDLDNLRVLLSFLGTRTTGNVGQTVVSAEWFAIRLFLAE